MVFHIKGLNILYDMWFKFHLIVLFLFLPFIYMNGILCTPSESDLTRRGNMRFKIHGDEESDLLFEIKYLPNNINTRSYDTNCWNVKSKRKKRKHQDCVTGLVTSHGTDFLLPGFVKESKRMYPQIRTKLHILISSQTTGLCTANYMNGSFAESKQFNLKGNDVSSNYLYLPVSQYKNFKSGIINTGVYLNCTEIVSVQVFSQQNYGYENNAYTALPTSSLSTTYLIPGLDFRSPLLGIVSDSNDTHVNIKLKSQCEYTYNGLVYESGETISLVLNRFDTLQLGQSTDCDFGGTLVQSDHPIAVFSGSFEPYPFRATPDAVHPPVWLQVPPITAFSIEVVVPAIYPRAKRSHLRLLAKDNNTNVRIQAFNGGAVTTYDVTLQYGQVKDLVFDEGVHSVIRSNNPILVVQLSEYSSYSSSTEPLYGAFLTYPDVAMYEKTYTLQSLSERGFTERQTLTVVSQTRSKMFIQINGVYLADLKWDELPMTDFSVGHINVNQSTFRIEAKDPVFVRLDGNGYPGSIYGIIGGYTQTSDINVTTHTGSPGETIDLHCLPKGWMVTVDLRTLPIRPSDVSSIYIGEEKCTGTLQGELLTFSVSYDECSTVLQVDNDRMIYENRIMFKSAENQWEQALQCKSSSHKTVFASFDKSETNSTTVTSEMEGNLVDITLYADRRFQHPMVNTVSLTPGTDVFVKVSSPVTDSVFVVNQCEMIIDMANSGGKNGAVQIIKDGCPVMNGTEVLLTRNDVTLFKFEMFPLGAARSAQYVTCDVTFCDKMDYSSRCNQRCYNNVDHNNVNPMIIG